MDETCCAQTSKWNTGNYPFKKIANNKNWPDHNSNKIHAELNFCLRRKNVRLNILLFLIHHNSNCQVEPSRAEHLLKYVRRFMEIDYGGQFYKTIQTI